MGLGAHLAGGGAGVKRHFLELKFFLVIFYLICGLKKKRTAKNEKNHHFWNTVRIL